MTGTHLYRSFSFPSRELYDGLIVMGGSMGVYDERQYPWLTEEIRFIEKSIRHGKAVLGICLGAQIILEHSEEGDTPCLGLLPGNVCRLDVPADAKIPHMGWNEVEFVPAEGGTVHPLAAGVEPGSQFYFVHSYAPVPADEAMVVGRTDYYGPFVSAVGHDNVVATQFHPERSGNVGLRVLSNFLRWNP